MEEKKKLFETKLHNLGILTVKYPLEIFSLGTVEWFFEDQFYGLILKNSKMVSARELSVSYESSPFRRRVLQNSHSRRKYEVIWGMK